MTIDAEVAPPDVEVLPPDANVPPETDCADGADNDGDGDTDCADSDCAAAPNCNPEVDCADGVDNDLDGDTDCADSDCAAAPNCNPEGECADGVDNDLDGATDCADSDCADACVAGCPSGSTAVAYTAGDLPQPIGATSTTSAVAVTEIGRVLGAAVRFNATHPFDADIDAYLISADGTTIELSTGNGGSGDNYTDTVFTDAAATAITAGTPPFTGQFQPEQPFATFLGEASDGTWTLQVDDNFPSADSGMTTGFDLIVCVCNGTAGCEVGAACRDGLDDDGDGAVDCADSDCAAAPNCLPEAICDDGVDNDFDANADCLDGDCDGIAGCELGTELTCDDGFDNDGDSDGDCLDTDCDGVAGCEFGTELTCNDLFDNDADGATDCTDSDCAADVWCTAETDCGDGLDNDGDGFADCLDFGCNGLAGCEFGAEVTCDDAADNDGDGAADCNDSDCASAFFCVPQPCPVGSTPTLVAASDTPVAVPDNTTVQSSADVTAAGVVTRVAVQINITHTYDGDLDISLASPGGAAINLSTANGGSGNDYLDTIFIDSGPGVIGTVGFNTPPFSGQYRPEQPLSTFDGVGATGAWNLVVEDTATFDTGTINAYRVFLCTCDGTAGCEFAAACADGLDNDGDGDIDCIDADCDGVAGCEAGTELTCDDLFDNDGDALADCLDGDCDGVAGCEFAVETTCNDSFDNDADGNIDCADGDCDALDGCEFGFEVTCDDGFDNDADGDVDCDDPDCAIAIECQVESDCADGIDNDLDGFADCLDNGCNGTDGCEFGVELSCNDGFDNDGDGVTDCLDSNCSTQFICAIPTCPADTVKQTFTATGLPIAIPDPGTTQSDISIPTAGLVADIAIRVNITHTFDSDVDLNLIAPSGTTRDVSTDNGSSGDNYTNTVFVDSAATSITAGTAPFTGSFRPEQPFRALYGSRLDGNWRLQVGDDFSGDAGTLDGYELLACTCDAASGNCELGFACRDSSDNDGDGLIDCADPNCASACAPETACGNGIDDDFDGVTDCADSDCAGVGSCETVEVTCTDRIDNDSDGLIDCLDPGCAGLVGCEGEPNDSAVTADNFDLFSFNGGIGGSVNPAGDNDYFVFTVPPGGNLALSIDTFGPDGVTCPAGVTDTFIHLYDSSGVTQLASDDDQGLGACSHIPWNAAPGTYYVRVRAFSATATLNYSLHIRARVLPVAVGETEPNDDGATATGGGTPGNDFSSANANGPFSSDTVIVAPINPAGDEDVYAITNLGATPARVHFESYGPTGWGTACTGDPELRVRNASGTQLGTDSSSGASTTCFFLPFVVNPGTTVYAHILENGDDAAIADYNLFISFP